MRGQPTNTSLLLVLELIKQYRNKQLSQEGFAAIFDVMHLAIEGILPGETYDLTYPLYALSRDLGDPDPRFCSSPAQLDEEIDRITPILEALYFGVVNSEPFYTRPDQDEGSQFKTKSRGGEGWASKSSLCDGGSAVAIGFFAALPQAMADFVSEQTALIRPIGLLQLRILHKRDAYAPTG